MNAQSAPPLGDSREAFMARVRHALEHSRTESPTEPAPAVDERLVRLVGPRDDVLDRFAKTAAATGMKVHRLTQREVVEKVRQLLSQLDAKRIAIGIGTLEQTFKLNEALAAGFDVADYRGRGLDVQYDLDAGITDVHAALGDTGSLVVCSDASHSRGLSLVPPTHLALVRRSDILPDMIDYWARLKGIPGTELPSSTVFITGPSKTADIEGELITGVHGPGEVHVLLIEDL